jgi:hypothetical protein
MAVKFPKPTKRKNENATTGSTKNLKSGRVANSKKPSAKRNIAPSKTSVKKA